MDPLDMYRDDQPYNLRFLDECDAVATRSPCNTQIGAVLVNPTVVGTFQGWNAPPYAVPTTTDCRTFCPRACKPVMGKDAGYNDCPTVHAEMMALVRAGNLTVGATLYVNGAPCRQCAKLIAYCKVAQVVCKTTMVMSVQRHLNDTVKYLSECGVKVWVINEPRTGVRTNAVQSAPEPGSV